MNKNLFLTLSAFLFLFPLSGKATGTYRPETSVAGFIQLPGSGRQVYDFNPGWRFFKGDISGAETVNFDDRSWEVVSTPHTVELMPAEASGCRNYQGPVWYRKHFVVPAETKGQRVSIHFEAAMGKQILYLNGKRIQEYIGGYLPFTLDLTTYGVQPEPPACVLFLQITAMINPILRVSVSIPWISPIMEVSIGMYG